MDQVELMKLFDFILENKEIQIGKGQDFTRDELIKIRKIVNGEIPNDFQLNAYQYTLLTEVFQEKELPFDENTPLVLLKSVECMESAIKRSITSADYIPKIPEYLEREIIWKAKKQGYILNEKSPVCLQSNFEIALESVKAEPQSADFINWQVFSLEEKEQLINLLINSDYVLNPESPCYLESNKRVIMSSLQKDISTIYFAETSAENDPEIFRYLLLHGFTGFRYPVQEKKLIYFQDKDTMETYLNLESESFRYGWENQKAKKGT